MTTAKVSMTGSSQAIHLPKEFHFKGKEIEIFHRGGEVVLREKPITTERFFQVLAQMPEDFYNDARVDEPPQDRNFE